jgi:hypothetical protein
MRNFKKVESDPIFFEANTMLHLVEAKKDKAAAQEKFSRLIRDVWRKTENRLIVWRPDAIELPISHDGDLWFASDTTGGEGSTLRYWNSFGKYDRTRNLNISVEINIPMKSNDARVSGFIARDPSTGRRYVMHDGGVGGGRKGIGRSAFLAWSDLSPVPVIDTAGKIRLGIIVAPLDGSGIDATLASFVKRVIAFKEIASNPTTVWEVPREREDALKDYFKEFSGRKSGVRTREFEYISRHGDVVDAVAAWARERIEGRIVKTVYLDLGVEENQKLVAIVEVKTSRERQCLYTAIGQLEVHSRPETKQRILAIPAGAPLPRDILQCLESRSIQILNYTLEGRKVVIET